MANDDKAATADAAEGGKFNEGSSAGGGASRGAHGHASRSENRQHGGRERGRKRDKHNDGRAAYNRQKSDKRQRVDEWVQDKRRKLSQRGEVDAAEIESNHPFSKEEIQAEERRPKRKVAVMVGYAGTGYKGMQVNGDDPTIERDLFRAFIAAGAISKANADDPKKSSLVRCARTDKGVHAAGNIISLKLIIEDPDVIEKINAALPPQIRVWGIERTNNGFSCYQACDSRWYEYLMPSYSLLPPHPQSYLGQKIRELAKEHGGEEELDARMADVKNIWEDVEENEVKPILAGLDPEVRAKVLERMHTSDNEEAEENKTAEAELLSGKTGSDQKAAAGEGDSSLNDWVMVDKEQPSEDTSTQNGAESTTQRGGVTLESAQPKTRELDPVDFALRDIKAAYINAKRRYRISPERMQRLQDILTRYEGTHNFYNYTVQKSFRDRSAKRFIKSFVVNPKPIMIGDTEWLSLKVHGQSFMMHQIRKMVGLASLMVRCGTPLDRVEESYGGQKMAIPKAPGLGLLLERPVFDSYNKRAVDTLGKETIDFAKYDKELQEFKDREIYKRIFDVEAQENAFHVFFIQIDQFKSDHFLWLSAGGLKVPAMSRGAISKTQADVDKELGDEDEEDPEGGEG